MTTPRKRAEGSAAMLLWLLLPLVIAANLLPH